MEGSFDRNKLMERVYAAATGAKVLVEGQQLTQLAGKLNESVQMVKNWDKRGPSAEGLLKIQRAIGVNATWVLFDEGPQMVGASARVSSLPKRPVNTPEAVKEIAGLLRQVKPPTRRAVIELLGGLADNPEDDNAIAFQVDALIESAKRRTGT